ISTSPMTRFPAMGPVPTGTICRTLHSRFTGDSANRGGFTLTDGTVRRPTYSASFSPYGSSLDDRLTCSASDATAAFTTNSPVASTFKSVSFLDPSRRRVGEKTTTGGFDPNALKKLNGARLTRPAGSTVVTHAIGRGVTTPTST